MNKQTQASHEERRGLERYPTRAHATLVSDNGTWSAFLLNLSDHGALIAVTEEHEAELNGNITLEIELENDSSLIMHGKVAHIKEHFVGLNCAAHGERDEERLSLLLKKLAEEDGQEPH